jgi:hypothetical protein
MTTQGKNKYNKRGSVLRCEPQSLNLVNSNPPFRVSFEQSSCMRFCEKIQGYNAQVTNDFFLNFNGVQTRVVDITFQESEDIVDVATEILVQREKWFKGIPIDLVFYTDFLKPKYTKQRFGATIPRECILEHYKKFLRVVQTGCKLGLINLRLVCFISLQ